MTPARHQPPGRGILGRHHRPSSGEGAVDCDAPPPGRRRAGGRWLARAGAALAVLLGGLLAAGVLPPSDATSDGAPSEILPELPVTAMNERVAAANNTPDLAVDPTDDDFVVMAHRLDAPDFSCALQVSGDGGRTWLPADPIPQLPEGAEKCYAPEVAFDRDGRLYYLFVGLAGDGNQPMGVFLTASDDRARSFRPPVQVLGPRNYAVRLALDPTVGEQGRLHLAWIAATRDPPLGGFAPADNPIRHAYSDDGGQSWSEPTRVSDPDRDRVVAPALAVGADRTVHLAYYDLTDDAVDYRGLEGPTWQGTWSLVLATAPDGRRFGDEVVVTDAIEPHERVLLIFTMPPPALASGPAGRVCTAWTDARFGDADALARCSADGGASWHDLVRLNDDAESTGAVQYQPQLATAPSGRIDAVFYDRRDTAERTSDETDAGFNHVSYTYSTDGGQSFAANRRLTSAASFTGIGQRYTVTSAQGRAEWGSRMGLASRQDRAVAAWTDTRNQRRGTGQDLFATTVVFSPPGGFGTAWPRLAGAALLAGAVVVLAWWRRSRARAPAAARDGGSVPAGPRD